MHKRTENAKDVNKIPWCCH